MTQYIIVEYGCPCVVNELQAISPKRIATVAEDMEQIYAFDQHSQYRLSITDVPRYGSLAKFLRNIIGSPDVPLRSEWVLCGEYNPELLIAMIKQWLENDDDIIQIQHWFGVDEIIRLLCAADTFEKMTLAVQCIYGGHESSDLVLDYAKSVLGPKWQG